MKRFKRAVFTVEAAFIIPVAAIIIVSLIGYIYFMHENVWSKAAAYEAGFYGIQKTENEKTAKELASERLNERYEENIFGFMEEMSEVTGSRESIKIKWSYGILPETFGELFVLDKGIEINSVDPVEVKRLMWAADRIMN
ncbi:MAG TPA: hypothetical protein IAB17_04485 [Candidatus Alectryocaccobium stercorigallinarum]|jgi:hypothetical protein|nr:hypothetical protein [Candidatus Alectryocaccobium stercorigallinarum]